MGSPDGLSREVYMKTFFIHKYKDTHKRRRKQFLKWFNQRKVEMIEMDIHGWTFIEIEGYPIESHGLGCSRTYRMRKKWRSH